MNASIIGPIAAAALVPIILALLLRSPSHVAKERNGMRWLEYGPMLKSIAIFLIALTALLANAWLTVPDPDRLAVAAAITLFGPLGLYLLLEFFGVRIGFNDTVVVCHSGWRKSRVIPWDELKSCSYSPTHKWWAIETRNAGHIRVHEFLSGRDTFFAALKSKQGIKAPDPSLAASRSR